MTEGKDETGPRLLRGISLSEEIADRVRARAEVFREASGRRPTAAVVGWTTDPTTRRYIDGKRRSFEAGGLELTAVLMDPADGTEAVLKSIDDLNGDEMVDGLVVQFPVPEGISQAGVVNRVDPAKDVDGGSEASRDRLREGSPCYASATAEAAVRLLGAHEIELEGRRVVVVGGQPSIAEPVALLLERAGARVTAASPGGEPDPKVAGAVQEAEVVIAAAGRPHGVSSEWLPPGCILVDTGYYHGGGRGDVAPGLGMTRVAAWVPPVGGVGPVTVSLLMEHTVAAAERTR